MVRIHCVHFVNNSMKHLKTHFPVLGGTDLPYRITRYSYTDDIIILLKFTFTDLHGYQITPGWSTDKQRHRLLLLKTGINVAPTHVSVMLSLAVY